MENKLTFSLFLSVIIVMSLFGLSIKQGYSQINNGTQVPANVTNNQTLGTAGADIMNRIINQNSDGRLDVQQPRIPSNETKVTRNGTLVIGGSEVPITYEQIGGLNFLEGDILLPSEIVDGKAAVDRFIRGQPWTNGEIPVVINSDVPPFLEQRILDSLAYIQSTTPITFMPVEIDENGAILDSHYVRIFYDPANVRQACYTSIGMLSPQDRYFTNPNSPFYIDGNYYGQPVVLPSWCEVGHIVHELGHILGLWHETTRCDRDQYIEIIWENILEDARSQFETNCDPEQSNLSPTSLDLPYDYCSIMHYGTGNGAVDPNSPTFIVTQEVVGCDESEIGIDSDDGFSPTDIAAINAVYSFVQ